MIWECLQLFFSFFKIGVVGFGGGYGMLSLIINEAQHYGITLAQFADLNALDMVVPGPIAINAATYVGYLHSGFWGALAATVGVVAPSFIIITLVMHFITRYKENRIMNGALSGIKPAVVGIIAASAMTIASGVLLNTGATLATLFTDPLGTISLFLAAIFVIVAVTNIKFKVNPILLTVLAGIVGAIFLK